MNIVLFGPPGSGKGTQAENLAKEYNLLKVSTGDLLREEISSKSKLGEEIDKKISKGFLVSDNILNNLSSFNLISKKENFWGCFYHLLFYIYHYEISSDKNTYYIFIFFIIKINDFVN